jgi:hypothetical protein
MNIADRQRPPPGELFLDHVSHFVPDLGAASELLQALGFAVTPLSVQRTAEGPAGASNRCVMLEAGYLEILTPTHDTPVAERMRAAMARHTGVHLVCFGTPDAEGEERRLAAHGFAPQPMVHLEREVEDGALARFKVVRVAPEKMPEGRIQLVEHLTPEHLWRAPHLAHSNGVTGLHAAYVVAAGLPAAAARWARFSALLPGPDGNFVRLDTARGYVLLGSQEAVSGLLGAAPAPPALAGYALRCADPAAFAATCERNGLRVKQAGALYSVVLPPALGGAWVFGTPQALT